MATIIIIFTIYMANVVVGDDGYSHRRQYSLSTSSHGRSITSIESTSASVIGIISTAVVGVILSPAQTHLQHSL